MIHCSSCSLLDAFDDEGYIVGCRLAGKKCFIDDLPLTTFDGCPLVEEKEKDE